MSNENGKVGRDAGPLCLISGNAAVAGAYLATSGASATAALLLADSALVGAGVVLFMVLGYCVRGPVGVPYRVVVAGFLVAAALAVAAAVTVFAVDGAAAFEIRSVGWYGFAAAVATAALAVFLAGVFWRRRRRHRLGLAPVRLGDARVPV